MSWGAWPALRAEGSDWTSFGLVPLGSFGPQRQQEYEVGDGDFRGGFLSWGICGRGLGYRSVQC